MIYEYQCKKCKVIEERLVTTATENKQYCKIDKKKMERLDTIFPLNFVLKGGSWH